MAEVFINYRTGDGDEAAEHINSYLAGRFGEEHVFKASHSLPPGALYPEALLDAARMSDVLLAVMGPDWSAAPQLEDEADWVRKEILAASSSNALVVPVLKGRSTDRLARASLPAELKWLADVHSLRLDMHQSEADLTAIGDFLADLLPILKAAEHNSERSASGVVNNSATDVTGNVVQGRDFHGDVNFLNQIYTHLKRFQPLSQPIDHLRRLAEHFVPPPGFDVALAALNEQGTVILAGPPGSGRTAAAQMLVFSSWPGQGIVHELEPQEPDDGSWFHVDPDLIGPHDGMWVDLSEADQQRWSQLQKELPALHTRVQERNARLVVIQPHRLDLRAEFRHYLRRIGVPPQVRVFDHLLRTEGLANDHAAPSPGFLEKPRSMGDIRQFIDDIVAAKEQSAGQGDLEAWITAAEQPTSPRETPVSEALDRLRKSSERALLLSVAMLHGAHADVIDSAAAALVASLPGEPDTPLERPPLGERLGKVGAETDAARHVHFTRSGYENTVRLFFWRHFPELHEKLTDWVRGILDSDDLSAEGRIELARGFTAQCLDDRYQFRWVALVKHLTEKAPEPSREFAAASILQLGLSDEANSRTFRRQIYDWSRAANGTSASLATALVAACQQMIDSHPGEAIVRLHHLARRHPERADIWNALVDAVYSNGRLLSLLLARLTDRPLETTLATDARIFLRVADPALFSVPGPAGLPLIAQDGMTDQFAAGWTLAYTRLPAKDWDSRARDWLRSAAEDDANRPMLVDVLVNGARAAPAVLPQLYGVAHRSAFRDAIADLVLEKISAAQGVELP